MTAVRHRADDPPSLRPGGGTSPSTGDQLAFSRLPAEWRRALAESELDEDQARHVMLALADRFGIALVHWTRVDIQARLVTDPGGPERELTPREWERVTRTEAWGMLPVLAEDAVADSGQLLLAIRQAGLECYGCGRALPADRSLPLTWGLCDHCRAQTSVGEILRAGCVAQLDGDHERLGDHCRRCGVPMPANEKRAR
ncbi:hypothetical protein M8C13_32690 [Crossiella sp. SN42]|uniref:hypothetical protein n=1 Tax=Crossiella sp. SN42 TaxID=2944808 RepID=UPI00207C7F93|nr:hypothetical protein [Crossiella sp. SN42]MCO1580523.1 hypothetical protein [Crossiella sp. SN42]